jgi:hypothetical protein
VLARRCRYCQQSFQPFPSHPDQLVCSRPECQRQRRADYRRHKLVSDPAYAEKCRQSARQWRKQHPGYWDQYRQAHPDSVDRNRGHQQARDRKRQLTNLANNTSASDLKRYRGTVWLAGSGLHDLANNSLAPAQLWILEALPRQLPVVSALANNTALVC